MDKLDDYLRIEEAAEFLGVSPNTLRNWGQEEKVSEFRHPINNYRLYRRSDSKSCSARRRGRGGPAAGGGAGNVLQHLWLVVEADQDALLRHRPRFLVEQAAESYGDVKFPDGGTVAERARTQLFEIRNLRIGKEAPDIEGEDQDGKRFHLSDYRGKVVLLDFWSYV